ncbi:MAG: hypothetical protein HUU46_10660 [Candidatus Hydrogenedentes bacterium]|nr:hypothetical protein [Candidatus Hydrogenedentota bacterium]
MGALSEISVHPPFPSAAVLGLGVLVAALVATAYWRSRANARLTRRLVLALLRCVAVVALVLVLLRPMRAEPNVREGERPIFAVVVDQSASMKTEDADGTSRDAAVRAALAGSRGVFEQALTADYDVRYFTFAHESQPAVLDEIVGGRAPTGTTTDLSAALLQSSSTLTNRALAGVLLISDGRDNAGGDVRRAATFVKGANAGVWTVPVGSETESHDVYVTARLKQSYLYVDQPGSITVTVSQAGFAGQYIDVVLLREGAPVATERVALTERGASIEFPVTEKAKGVVKYAVEVSPLPGEADSANNKRTVFVRAVDERTKVLFVEARPYWDSKFLLRALQRDQNVEVTSLFQIKEDKIVAIAESSAKDAPEKSSITQGISLPKSKEDLFRFDCLILGKGVDVLLTAEQLALVRDFVRERGGGVVFSRARSYGFDNEALAALEPLVWERDSVHGKRFELTPEGKTSPVFSFGKSIPSDTVIRELPEMVSVTKVAQEKSLSVVLARSKEDDSGLEMATIAYQRYGKGKVMSVGATGLWRWAITPPELAAYDDVFERFWGQMIRWLVSDSDFLPGQEISFRTDRYTYNLGEMVQLAVRTKFVDGQSFSPSATVVAPSGKFVELPLDADPQSPGVYTARFLPEEEGEFVATLSDSAPESTLNIAESAPFTVYSDNTETRFVSADRALMADIARVTGGEALSLDQLNTLPERMRAFERKTATDTKFVDIWDKLGVFAALLSFLTVEWFARRRSGLV